MSSNSLTPIAGTSIVDPQAQRIVEFLQGAGLPAENIIADQSQRHLIGQNLDILLAGIPANAKKDARYLSKFVVGAASGLFDYSLNSIWNEVVVNLRKKATFYGLDIFFDAAVGGSKNRDFYETEDDLSALKDSVLLDTCRKLELISDTTYKKLRHISEMRNDIGISHPTSYSINAFDLLSWLQTCINDVLNDQPTEAALQVQSFIANLRNLSQPLDSETQKTVEGHLAQLPSHLCGSLLRTVFGIFVAVDTDPAVRKNISSIAPTIWNNCLEDPKYKLGIVLEGYKSNLHQEKYDLGQQFFSVVGGNPFRSTSERSIIVDSNLDDLWAKHHGWDNFANEAPVAASLASYHGNQSDILPNVATKLFKYVLMCRIGRGITYNNGVSPRAKAHYNQILSLAGDQYAGHVMAALAGYEIQSKLTAPIARQQAVDALTEVKNNVINQRLNECLDYLIAHMLADGRAALSKPFRELSKQYITWTE